MENATRALLMAAGVLIGIIIISVMVITLQKTGNVSQSYDKTVQTEEITKFNSNFTKYLGRQDLTIHEVVTITNFAYSNGVTVTGRKTTDDINETTLEEKYSIKINSDSYDANGYIKSIEISQ